MYLLFLYISSVSGTKSQFYHKIKKKLNGDHYIHHFIGACSVAYACRNNDGLYAKTLLRS